jgi:hypothetical protein
MAGLLLLTLKRRVYISFSIFYRVLSAVNPRTRAEAITAEAAGASKMKNTRSAPSKIQTS